jgi:hypothetical protein
VKALVDVLQRNHDINKDLLQSRSKNGPQEQPIKAVVFSQVCFGGGERGVCVLRTLVCVHASECTYVIVSFFALMRAYERTCLLMCFALEHVLHANECICVIVWSRAVCVR